MLISGARAPYEGDMELREWLRAPLAINNGARCHIALEPAQDDRRRCEFIVSTIDPSHWSDLWRIEFETRDEPGVFAGLFDLLHQCRIHVVSAEASAHTLQERNASSIVISCARYQNGIDGNSTARVRDPEAGLKGLEDLIKLNFLDMLTVNTRGDPRVNVRRMDALWRTKDAVNARRLPAIEVERLVEGRLPVPEKFRRDIAALGPGLLQSVSVDTKNRILRVLIWPREAPLGHMQFYIPDNPTGAARRLFQILLGLNANILKFQIRPGGNKLAPESARGEDAGFRLDVTFEALRGDLDKVLEVCGRKAMQDMELRASGMRLLLARSELDDEKGRSHEI